MLHSVGLYQARPTMSFPVLEAVNVSKTFPDSTVALHTIHWAVRQGETMVLIGESGSGKTTFLRLLNRLDEPTTGRILIRGQPATQIDPIQLRRRIGYVQQEGGLLPHWTVADNLTLVPRLLGWSREQRQAKVESLLTLVNLNPAQYRNRYPAELFGGQRQRIAVARALAGDPDIVLLDEPFGALDALTRIELQEQFLYLKHQIGKTMVLVTHDLQEAFALGDRIAIFQQGRLLQMGTPLELTQNPAHDYVRKLLGHRQALQVKN